MQPIEPTTGHIRHWAAYPTKQATFTAPDDPPDCEPCAAVITEDPDGRAVVRVPWTLNEIELAQLANGGTIWLSCWGGLPAHSLEVQP